MIIFIDNQRKYKFQIGHNVKVGNSYYRIEGIERLYHKEAAGSVAASSYAEKDFDSYMKPLDGFMYFVEFMSIDGNCGFNFQFPKGIPHGGPRGNVEYLYFLDANPSDPLYLPFLILPPHYPSLKLYNPTAAANNSDIVFKGERWKIRKLDYNEIPPEGKYTELTDYMSGGIGQG